MSDNRTILQNKNRKTRTPFSKDVLVFLFCLALSTFFWFLYTLSKDKEVELYIPVEYVNFPINYMVTDTLHKQVKVKVKVSGFSVLMYQLNNKKESIQIDFKSCSNNVNGDRIYIGKKVLKKKVMKSISSTMSLLNIEPTQLEIPYEKLYEKVVSIKLNGKIDLSQQHILKEKIQLIPSRITVYGPKSMLDTLSVIYTNTVSVNNLSASTKILTTPKPIHNIRFKTSKIKVVIPVELFTEKTIVVPIVGKNLPENTQLRTFPATVNVSFIVGLSKFKLITPDDIQASIDFKSLVNNKEGMANVQVTTTNSTISNLKKSPRMVEYILEKK